MQSCREGGRGEEKQRCGRGGPEEQAEGNSEELMSRGCCYPERRMPRHGDKVGDEGEGDGDVRHELAADLAD